jgi:hypothetical protein
LEDLVKGFVKKGNLENLKIDLEKSMEGSMKTLNLICIEERMGHMENMVGHMENMMGHMKDDIVESIVKLLQNLEEKFPKDEDAGQGSQEDKYNDLVY